MRIRAECLKVELLGSHLCSSRLRDRRGSSWRCPTPNDCLNPACLCAETVLERVEDATIVPEASVITRGDQPMVFVLDPRTMTVQLTPVKLGISDAGRAQVIEGDVSGRVVTLGQQLLDDGSSVVLSEEATAEAATSGKTAK